MTPKNPPDFSKRLDLLMKGEGWSTRDLAEQTGGRVSHSTINSWVNDATRASTDQIAIVAEILGWSVDELYYGRGGSEAMNRLAEIDAAMRQAKRATESLMAALGVTADVKVGGEKPPKSRRAAGGS